MDGKSFAIGYVGVSLGRALRTRYSYIAQPWIKKSLYRWISCSWDTESQFTFFITFFWTENKCVWKGRLSARANIIRQSSLRSEIWLLRISTLKNLCRFIYKSCKYGCRIWRLYDDIILTTSLFVAAYTLETFKEIGWLQSSQMSAKCLKQFIQT